MPAGTLKIRAGGESIVVTGLLRFWKAGKGWTIAHDLKAGDRLRVCGTTVEVELIEPGSSQKVYSLEVAESRDIFVGASSFSCTTSAWCSRCSSRLIEPPGETVRNSGPSSLVNGNQRVPPRDGDVVDLKPAVPGAADRGTA